MLAVLPCVSCVAASSAGDGLQHPRPEEPDPSRRHLILERQGRKELSATVCDMDYPQSLDALPGSGQKADFSVRSILTPSKLAEL